MSPSEAPSSVESCATAMFMAALSLVVPICARMRATSGAYDGELFAGAVAVRMWERDDMKTPPAEMQPQLRIRCFRLL